jgi:hypothetical protein
MRDLSSRKIKIIALETKKGFEKDTKHTPSRSNPEDKWFYDWPEEKQRQYIKEHPNSKFAKEAKKEETPGKGIHHHVKKHALKLSQAIKDFHEDQKKFFQEGQYKPESNERRKLSQMVVDKKKGLAKSIKHEVKEWRTGANALRKLKRGESLDHHDKAALKAIAVHSGIVMADIAATGGLMHGVGLVVAHFIKGMLQHSLMIHFGKSAIYSSVPAYVVLGAKDEQTDDELLEELIDMMAEGVSKANFKPADWVRAFKKANKGNKGHEKSK